MQEDVILEIPEETNDSQEWMPPVLKKAELPEQKQQSCADVFFVQYAVCIILLTILFSVRLWDEQSFQNVIELFNSAIHQDSEPWVLSLIAQVKELWN